MIWYVGLLALVEFVLLLAFSVTAVEAEFLRGVGVAVPFKANEVHHAYLGALLVIVAVTFGGGLIAAAGVIITADDVFQHVVQTREDTGYRSPLNRLFGVTLWRVAAVRNIVRWLDARLA